MRFDEVNLDENVLQGIEAMNFQEMTPVQEQTIPVILEGNCLLYTSILPFSSRIVAILLFFTYLQILRFVRFVSRVQQIYRLLPCLLYTSRCV